MANLGNFNVVEKANKGSLLELTAPSDLYDEKTGELLYSSGDVLTDEGEKIADSKNIRAYSIKLLGCDSDEFRHLSNRKMEKASRISKKDKNKVTIDSINKENCEIFAKCTTECYLIGADGKEMECTYSTMLALYLKEYWIYEQVDAFMAERSNFTRS